MNTFMLKMFPPPGRQSLKAFMTYSLLSIMMIMFSILNRAEIWNGLIISHLKLAYLLYVSDRKRPDNISNYIIFISFCLLFVLFVAV